MTDSLLHDLRLAVRALRRSPGFTAAAALTLALGIGATTAVFGIVDAVLLRPLPYPAPDRLVRLYQGDRHSGTTREGFSTPDFLDLRERSRTLEGAAAFRTRPMALGGEEAERVSATHASHELFPLLGASPLLGRAYDAAEDSPGGEPVVVLGERLWRRRFGADPAILGRTVLLDDRAHVVVGVLPADFAFPSAETDLWVPLRAAPTSAPRGVHDLGVVARLAPGATLDGARREIATIAAELEAEHPADNEGRDFLAVPLRDALVGDVRPRLLLLLGATTLVLLVACANVAHLLLARATTRSREVAVRTALGATRGRLARQFTVEALVLALLGGTLGVGLAGWALDLLVGLVPGGVPRIEAAAIDGRVLAVVATTLTAVGLVFGLAPALARRDVGLHATLREAGAPGLSASRRRVRARGAHVVAEIALAVTLVGGASLLIRSFARLLDVDPGFRAENVVKLDFQLPARRYPQAFSDFPEYPEIRAFHGELLRRVATIPGVSAAAIAVNHPVDPGWTTSFRLEGQTEAEAATQPETSIRIVSPDYFRTVGVPLLRGRLLEPRDDGAAPRVVVVNAAFARRHLSGVDPIGRRIELFGRDHEIVGVVGDERFDGLGAEPPPAVYPPLAQMPLSAGSLLVLAAGRPEAVIPQVRAIFRELDPQLAVFGVEALEETLAGSIAAPRFTALLLGLFAALALALAVVGVHGVLGYTVAQRSREIGIRLALGASRARVTRDVVAEGLRLAALGLALGLAGTLALGHALRGMLFGIGAADPATLLGVAALLAAVATAASWLPARRAAKVDPMTTLRGD
jgi:predicted permease